MTLEIVLVSRQVNPTYDEKYKPKPKRMLLDSSESHSIDEWMTDVVKKAEALGFNVKYFGPVRG